ncbi:hypothetical protein ACN1C3_17165 [Pseudomonas sp. H11T01]|uniref:hypothetical protein n=1 Tax=Pseudomonas sp. H11T01 TaxID=3402749 RepID=UPI003AC834A7
MNNEFHELSAPELAARIEYFDRLQILEPAPKRTKRHAVLSSVMRTLAVQADPQDSASVIGKSVVAYDRKMTPQNREDVDDSILFAQLVAGRQFDPETHLAEWFKEYARALEMAGWGTTSHAFSEFQSREIKFTMDEAALQIIAAIAGPDKLQLLSMVTGAFKALEKNENALKLFELKSKKNHSGNFQVVPCILTADGQLTMVIACMHLVTKVSAP